MNQFCNIVNETLMNIFGSNFVENWNVFIEENTIENVVCEMVAVLSRLQYVNV